MTLAVNTFTRDCDYCNEPYEARSTRSRFGSSKCGTYYRRWYAPERACERCGEMFDPLSERARFCSDGCRWPRMPAVLKAAA